MMSKGWTRILLPMHSPFRFKAAVDAAFVRVPGTQQLPLGLARTVPIPVTQLNQAFQSLK